MANYVALFSPYGRAELARFAGPITYTPHGGPPLQLAAFIRGLRTEDTFAAAMQMDQVAVIDAVLFESVTGFALPRRFDRIVQDTQSFAVQDWRPAPAVKPYVFLKLLIRGSQQ